MDLLNLRLNSTVFRCLTLLHKNHPITQRKLSHCLDIFKHTISNYCLNLSKFRL